MKLLPPIFRAGAAILSEKIDALAEQVHQALDGGLDADNLAPGFQLAPEDFFEGRGLFILRGDALLGIDGGGPGRLIAKTPVAARIVGFSARLQAAPTVTGEVGVGTNAGLVGSVSLQGKQIKTVMLPAPVAVPAGALIYGVTTINLTAAAPYSIVTVYLDALHVG